MKNTLIKTLAISKKKVKLSDKYRGILSKKQGESLHKHIAEMRSEWINLS